MIFSDLNSIVKNPPYLTFCLTKHLSVKSPQEIKTRLKEFLRNFVLNDYEEILENLSTRIFSANKNSIYCIVNSKGETFLKETDANLKEFLIIDNFPKIIRLLEYEFWYEDYLLCIIERKVSEIFFVRDGNLELFNLIVEDVPNRVKYGGLLGFEENRIRRHIEHHEIQYLKNIASLIDDISVVKKINKVVLGVRQDFREEVETVFGKRNTYIFAEVRLEDDLQKKISSSMDALMNYAYFLSQKRLDDLNLKPLKLEQVLNCFHLDYLVEIFVPNNFEVNGHYCKDDLEISFDEVRCPLCGSSMLQTANLLDVLLYKLSMRKTKINFFEGSADAFFILR